MKTAIPITKAQADLPKLIRSGETVIVLRHGVPVSVIMPHERMELILETMEVLANPEAMAAIKAYRKGKLKAVSLKTLDKELNGTKARG